MALYGSYFKKLELTLKTNQFIYFADALVLSLFMRNIFVTYCYHFFIPI